MSILKPGGKITRRRLMELCIKTIAWGGLFTIIIKFIRGVPALPAYVSFSKKPLMNQVIFCDRVFLVNVNNTIKAFYDQCPHLGCSLSYKKNKSIFQCPCHGSQFTIHGKCIRGPAQKNMKELELEADKKCGSYTARLPIA